MSASAVQAVGLIGPEAVIVCLARCQCGNGSGDEGMSAARFRLNPGRGAWPRDSRNAPRLSLSPLALVGGFCVAYLVGAWFLRCRSARPPGIRPAGWMHYSRRRPRCASPGWSWLIQAVTGPPRSGHRAGADSDWRLRLYDQCDSSTAGFQTAHRAAAEIAGIGETIGINGPGGLLSLVGRMASLRPRSEILGHRVDALGLHTREGLTAGAWTALFQSVSAFNNAGFDVFGIL